MAPATSLARLRKRVLDLVAKGGLSVVEACRHLGISRSRYYELRKRYLTYGEAGLLPKPPAAGETGPPGVAGARRPDCRVRHQPPHLRPRTIASALALQRYGGWVVSHGGVYNVLRRAGLERTQARLAAAEALAAEGGPITERALRELRALVVTHRHIGSDLLGEQVFLDTMYVGKLKGVGKIWQYSAVDGACSFGFAQVRSGEKSAKTAARFLERHVLPVYSEAGIALVEVVVGRRGGVQRGAHQEMPARGISIHRLPPRSPDLNAFVERFQGTVLHLRYRTAFRYRFYTSARDIDDDLQAWLRFYNFERPHGGYRTRGR
jgi:transposase InsO family protein